MGTLVARLTTMAHETMPVGEHSPDIRRAPPAEPGSWADDTRVWAPPRDGVTTEAISAWEVVVHGARAGLLAGIVLGIVEILATAALGGDPLFPFAFAAGILIGPGALAAGFSTVAAIALGTVIHLLISIGVGVMFVAALHVTFQLSARPLLMVIYGVLYGVTVWEVNFLAVLPIIAPGLVGQLDLATQLVNGVVTYTLVFGPVLAVYVLVVRPGVHDRWWQHDPDTASGGAVLGADGPTPQSPTTADATSSPITSADTMTTRRDRS